jgi:putative ABC transport system permease protein
MEQRQIRAMVRSEAVIPSLFGAAIGVVVGTGLGTALVASLQHSHEITVIVLPFGRLVVFLLIAAGLGLGAAAWPARRAARLDVLAAIATE